MRQMDIAPGLRITNERCAILLASRTMVLGDMHLGIEASLELDGVQLPRAQGAEMRKRVTEATELHHPRRIIVLGDMKHEFSRNLDQEWSQVRGMLEHMRSLAEVTVVRGNHDNFLANITSRMGVDLVDELQVDGYHLSHGHIPCPHRPLIQGHEHPSARLFDGVGGYVKMPAFLHHARERILIIPAFSPLAAGNDVGNIGSGDTLSPGLRDVAMGEAEVYGCSDIGLIRLGRVEDLRRRRHDKVE
jgi:putative SbcD/Mre11-related phosphoesterase